MCSGLMPAPHLAAIRTSKPELRGKQTLWSGATIEGGTNLGPSKVHALPLDFADRMPWPLFFFHFFLGHKNKIGDEKILWEHAQRIFFVCEKIEKF